MKVSAVLLIATLGSAAAISSREEAANFLRAKAASEEKASSFLHGHWIQGQADAVATYSVSFRGLWTQQSFPNAWTGGGAFAGSFWAPSTFATHSSSYHIWQRGSNASPEVQTCVETGNPGPLNEALAASDQVLSNVVGRPLTSQQGGGTSSTTDVPGHGLGGDPLYVTANKDYGYLSFIAMAAPTPDWFVGVNAIELCTTDRWVESLSILLYPYDGGVSDGEALTFKNGAATPGDVVSPGGPATTTPQGPIHLLTNSIFNDPTTGTSPPLGILTIDLISVVDAQGNPITENSAPGAGTPDAGEPLSEEAISSAVAAALNTHLSDAVVNGVVSNLNL